VTSEVYEVVPAAAIISFLPKGDIGTCETDTDVYFGSQELSKWAEGQEVLRKVAL
jgi:hypothetical protein